MSGSVYKDERNTAKPWVARWSTPDGKRPTKSFVRKRDAEAHLVAVLGELQRGDYVNPEGAKTRLGDYAELFIRTRAVRRTTTARYRRELKHLESIADLTLGACTPSVMEQWQARLLADGLKPSYVGQIRNTVNAMFRAAIRDKLVRENPFSGVRKPERAKGKLIPLTQDEVRHIAGHVAPWYRAAVWLCAGCGLRPGEAFGLTMDRVDFLRRVVHVERTLTYVNGDGFQLGPPKTPKSERVVPLPQFVGEALAQHIERFGRAEVDDVVTGRTEPRLIFASRGGGPVSSSLYSDSFRRVAPKGFTFHDLRHHFASVHIHNGANVLELAELMGHDDASETLGTYSHLFKGADDRARQRMETAWSEYLTGAGADEKMSTSARQQGEK